MHDAAYTAVGPGDDADCPLPADVAWRVGLTQALSLGGDPVTVEEEYARAAGHSSHAGDLLQVVRIDVIRAHHLLADARFGEAVEIAAVARAAAEELDLAPLLVVALGIEAEGLMRLGRYDEAIDRCQQALSMAGRIGTRRTAGALVGLAQVSLRRGAREQARAALEQALRLNESDPDRQLRVPALACLSVALLPEEVGPASALAETALQESQGSSRLPALLAAGRVAWSRGDRDAAVTLAGQAVEHARRRRERAWLAEALELRATIGNGTVEKGSARSALREALQIWEDAGATHDADRVHIQLAQLPSATTSDRLAGRLALARLAAAGVLDIARFVMPTQHRSVRIKTFGRFEVCVDEAPVPPEAWQSRQARDLVRLLVCRRGRAVPRLEICETLWPDQDPDRTMHRLSVLLSIVRGVLGPDAIAGDSACVALSPARVQVDAEQFLADVSDGVALHERGSVDDARALLAEAVGAFIDEPFADAPYDDAVGALRDELQAAHQQALRLLAEACRRAGECDRAAAYLRRLLAADCYDEDAHRSLLELLVRAGRHGQARLAAARYRAAMADLGLPPADVRLRAVG